MNQQLPQETKLGILHEARDLIAKTTGIRWQDTSWIRDSPGHVSGDALDIAPYLMVERTEGSYKGGSASDPVLHLRPVLLSSLITLSLGRLDIQSPLALLVAIENDHLHLQLVIPHDARDQGRFIALPLGRNMSHRYPDSADRQLAASRLRLV